VDRQDIERAEYLRDGARIEHFIRDRGANAHTAMRLPEAGP
jgi:hypothetical protein